MKTTHRTSFVSDYGKLWEIEFTAIDGEVDGVNWIKIDEKYFDVKTVARENRILAAVEKRVDLYEVIADDTYERETHHFVDND